MHFSLEIAFDCFFHAADVKLEICLVTKTWLIGLEKVFWSISNQKREDKISWRNMSFSADFEGNFEHAEVFLFLKVITSEQ